MNKYRPWGDLDWALGLSASRKWSFLGCVGPEERAIHAIGHLHGKDLISNGNHRLLRVKDVVPTDHEQEEQLCQVRLDQCKVRGLQPHTISFGILDPIRTWIDVFDAAATESVILDISSMPKRIFFAFLKRLLKDAAVKNLVIAYTVPAGYDDGPLSGNVEDWEVLPGFRPDDPDDQNRAAKKLIVNVGFMPEGLLEHLGDGESDSSVHLLIPFPAPVRTLRRTWGSVKRLVEERPLGDRCIPHRISPQDMSEAFAKLRSLSDGGVQKVSLAPFGPKPISAAMCIFAAQTGMPVFYAQPKTYSLSYSNGVHELLGYWIKHDGQNLYSI